MATASEIKTVGGGACDDVGRRQRPGRGGCINKGGGAPLFTAGVGVSDPGGDVGDEVVGAVGDGIVGGDVSEVGDGVVGDGVWDVGDGVVGNDVGGVGCRG